MIVKFVTNSIKTEYFSFNFFNMTFRHSDWPKNIYSSFYLEKNEWYWEDKTMKAKWSHSIFSPDINTFLNKYSKIYKQNKNDIITQKLYEMGYTNL